MSDLSDTVIEYDLGESLVQPEREPARNGQGYILGVCRHCGDQASTPSSTYCDDHRTKAQREGIVTTSTSLPTGTASVKRPERQPARGKTPSGDEWTTKVFDKGIIVLTTLFAASAIRRYNVNDPSGALEDELTATDEEARAIAKPLGRVMAASGLNKRYGRKVLDNSDLIDAGIALWDWYDRVNKMLKSFAGQERTHLASVSPIVPTGGETIEQTDPQASSVGQPFPDFGPPLPI